jgi:uncharacterized protein with PIN domain
MARLYANENFPQQVVEKLRQLGHDVLTSHDSGKSGRGVPDEDVLQFATAERRILVTLNRQDFIRLHRASAIHAGIVVCTVDLDYIALAMRVHDAIAGLSSADGQLLRVNRPRD